MSSAHKPLLPAMVALVAALPANAQSFPSSDDWRPVLIDGDAVTDPCGDVNGSAWWDIVGTSDLPAAFVYDDGTYLWFRLRIAGAPYTSSGDVPSKWRSFGWGVMIESDWDRSAAHYDQLVYVDGNDDRSVLAQNTIGSTPWYYDPAEVELVAYDAPLAESGPGRSGTVGWTRAGSDVCNGTGASTDFFLDWAVPWADLSEASGAESLDELGLLFGTSASTSQFSKDVAGCDNDTDDCEDYWDSVSDGDGGDDGSGTDGSSDGGAGDGGAGDGGAGDGGAGDGGDDGGDDGSGGDAHDLDGDGGSASNDPFDLVSEYVGGGYTCSAAPGTPGAWLILPLAVVAGRRRKTLADQSADRR